MNDIDRNQLYLPWIWRGPLPENFGKDAFKGKGNFKDEFKRNGARQITARGNCPVAAAPQRLGVSQHSFYKWKTKED